MTWIEQLRTPVSQGAGVPKIVPRVLVELEGGDHVEMLTGSQARVIDMLAKECTARGYDGLVLEVWMTWVAMSGMANDDFREAALLFVRRLAAKLHALPGRKELIIATPPAVPAHPQGPAFDAKDFAVLKQEVDGFSIMTYDYSAGAAKAGPNAPLGWLEQNLRLLTEQGGMYWGKPRNCAHPSMAIQAATAAAHADGHQGGILLGLNFYGYHFSPQGRPSPMVNDEVLRLLAKHQPRLEWQAAAQEHAFTYEDKAGVHRGYYPTPRALQQRLQLSAQRGVGVSIWELGQGLECFFDLL